MSPHKNKTKQVSGSGRALFFAFCLVVIAGGVLYRLFSLAVLEHERYVAIAQAQYYVPSAVLSGRGSVYGYDRATGERMLLAANQKTGPEIRRTYPRNMLASQVLGFVGYRDATRAGQYGIEGFYNADLQDGRDIVLTIDPTIQSYAQAALDRLLNKWSSPHGTIIIQEPSTGALLAIASSPSFDPNRYGDFNYGDYLNPATQRIFEPGSSFKPFTMAAGIDSGRVALSTGYEDSGAVIVDGYTIRNYDENAHGYQTMRQVLERSLNTGTIFVERRTGHDMFLNYVVGFGFGQKTGVDSAGELAGNIANLYAGREINFLTASFGQGIAVTPLQLVNAYSAIANGGRLMKPYLVKEVIRPDGSVAAAKPAIIGAPITDRTADIMKELLVGVVDRGFDKARIKGYDVAGKTGTAQIPDPKGGYLENKQFIHNFVGFAPAYNPRFTILIKMDRPQGITFAADSLSPVFGDLAAFMLRYLKIPPTRS